MLTSPMNQVSLLAQKDLHQPQTQPGVGFFSRTNRRPASLQELDEQVADLRQELRFSSSVPISHWIGVRMCSSVGPISITMRVIWKANTYGMLVGCYKHRVVFFSLSLA